MANTLWTPSPAWRDTTNIGRFARYLVDRGHLPPPHAAVEYDDMWRWSIDHIDDFWASIWEYFDIHTATPMQQVRSAEPMPDTRWFVGATINYADHALRNRGTGPAIIARSQTRPDVTMSWDDLARQVGAVRAGLIARGVQRGDRVVAYLPNIPETIVAFLATASIGAVWSSCAPEFGVQAVVDRFAQIEPTVLFVVDGYRYGTKEIDCRANVAAIVDSLPTVRHVVGVPYLGELVSAATVSWDELGSQPGDPYTDPVPPSTPLYVLYSSGTTGLPKPIVHGHGGILAEHLKTLALHADLGPGDRFMWFTTTGWMMWNYLVSGLLVGATVVLFDGDPGSPDIGTLWRTADELDVTWLGLGAPFITQCAKADLRPRADLALTKLRAVGSTGAPLPPEGFRWVYDALGPDVMLSSISGGTDVCSAFVGGCPAVPVWEGEISCRYLGAAVDAIASGHPASVGEQGELVITEPMPSMPVGFWNDRDGVRYRAAYFDTYPGVWCHGDWVTFTERGSCVISGRSDATLNRGGVRIGTAEIYRVVQAVDGIDDSVIVHLDTDPSGPGTLVLLVSGPRRSDEAAHDEIRRSLRNSLSPRHVPDEIHAVTSVATTLSGKKLELPTKRMLLGAAADDVASRDALRDPNALDEIEAIAERRRTR